MDMLLTRSSAYHREPQQSSLDEHCKNLWLYVTVVHNNPGPEWTQELLPRDKVSFLIQIYVSV